MADIRSKNSWHTKLSGLALAFLCAYLQALKSNVGRRVQSQWVTFYGNGQDSCGGGAFFQERDKVIIRRMSRCLMQNEGDVKAGGWYDQQSSKKSVNIPAPSCACPVQSPDPYLPWLWFSRWKRGFYRCNWALESGDLNIGRCIEWTWLDHMRLLNKGQRSDKEEVRDWNHENLKCDWWLWWWRRPHGKAVGSLWALKSALQLTAN